LGFVVAIVDKATLEEGDASIDDTPPEEDGLDDDDDGTATEVLDVADVDRVMGNADGSSPMTDVDMIEKAAGQLAGLRNRIGCRGCT
jgi:hypothetical protein